MQVASSLKIFLLAMTGLALTGCASIVSESRYPVSITSDPPGAQFRIKNQDGFTVHSGVTPDQIMLKAGAGYFDGETYTVTYKKDGYITSALTLDSEIDGWYWGNIIFGGAIGMLIVDPATGAMFSLSEHLGAYLKPAAASIQAENPSLAQVETPLLNDPPGPF